MSGIDKDYSLTIAMAYRYAQLIAGMDLSGALVAINTRFIAGSKWVPVKMWSDEELRVQDPSTWEERQILYALLECKNHLPKEFLDACRR